MIHYVTGDLLLSRAELVAHGIAPDDEFKTGLALELRTRWPGMYKDFRHACHTQKLECGDVWTWAGPGARIAALFTQEAAHGHHQHPGKATVPHVNHALRQLRHFVDAEGIKSVALPRLATGVGGLPWTEVKPLIEHHFQKSACEVFVYEKFATGVAADEGPATTRH